MITVLIMGTTMMTARAQSGFETEPVLKAKDLVAPELLKGPHFSVDDRVPVKGFLAYFTIRSDYGTFQRLQGVNGLASIVDFAAAAKTQDETRFVAGSVNILARYHESVAPIAVTTAPGPIIGRTTNGTLVIPAAVDYVAWTERVGRMAQRDDFKAPDRTTWLSGQMSIRARKEFTARGWRVDESFSIAAER